MARFIALLDASALFSIRVTNLALEVVKAGVFQPRWSAMIHAEWRRSVLKTSKSAAPAQIDRRLQMLDEAFPDAMVTGFEPMMAGLSLPDADDVHVLAAAMQARADVIVTFDTRHFPDAILETHGLEAQHPDTFLLHQMTLEPPIFVGAARAVRAGLSRPPHPVGDFLGSLKRAGLPLVADALAGGAASL